MRLLAVIPARLGATRLPRKPLRLLGGRPLVVRVWERIASLEVAERCVVATDDEEVAAVVRAAGGDAVLTRADHPSGTDRVAEVATRAEFAGFDAVVNIQGDEPFASAEVVHAASALVTRRGYALGTVACPAAADVLLRPDVVKVVATDDGRALYFSRAPVPYLREPGDAADRARRDALVHRHVGIYAYTREALVCWVALPPHPLELVERLEQLRPLAAGMAMGVAFVPEAPLPGIDTEDDLVDANARWPEWSARRAAAAPPFTSASASAPTSEARSGALLTPPA
ncbi:MAG: 3-deoxy-manno-octulosonate cytidylyltransferase [Gemmatirosa sp.]